MTEMAGASPEKKSGCGLLGAMFGRRGFWLRRPTASGPSPVVNGRNNSSNAPKRRRGSSDGTAFSEASVGSDEAPKPADKIIPRPGSNHHARQPQALQQNQSRKPKNNETAMVTAGSLRKVPKEAVGISGELESIISDHQRARGGAGLVRASSSNVMIVGNLGNLRQPGDQNANDVKNYPPKTARDKEAPMPAGKYSNSVMGNVVKAGVAVQASKADPPASLCRAISTRMDPEQLKILGNEDFKNGRFAEALALYDAAISIDPNKASYRSNKSAALTALGRILEAVFECREAIRIEPYYNRAHQRLGTLYVRLGEAEKALYHYKHAGSEADPDDVAKAKMLQSILNRCTNAKKQRDWNTLLKETATIISTAADSAPQIYALQAEALLRLRRHQEADEILAKGPNFDIEECTKFFGPYGNATVLVVRAQVDMAAGRFEDAVQVAEHAARLDSNNREVSAVVRRARAAAAARSKGNELFKAGKFSEACGAYGEGLNLDPFNSVLLSNRAACRSKLGELDKAVEDCNAALNVRPSYSKARLRRADCYAKLGKWEASRQDYEILVRESPEDEEVGRGLREAQAQLKRQVRGVVNHTEVQGADDVVWVPGSESFKEIIMSPGKNVVLFYKKPGERSTLQFMEQLSKKFSSINFLKVDIEELPQLVRSEGVEVTPCFRIYNNSSKVKEIPSNNHDELESLIRYCATT